MSSFSRVNLSIIQLVQQTCGAYLKIKKNLTVLLAKLPVTLKLTFHCDGFFTLIFKVSFDLFKDPLLCQPKTEKWCC